MALRFRHLLAPLVALAASPLAAACGGASDQPSPTTPPTTTPTTTPKPGATMTLQATCFDPESPNRYGALTPAPGTDGIAFFNAGGMDGGQDLTRDEPLPIGNIGEPCKTATDKTACEAAVAAAAKTEGAWTIVKSACGGCQASTVNDRGVSTAGSAVTPLRTYEDLRAAVAPVESADEAAVLLRVLGRSMDCGTPNARPDGDGFTLKVTSSSCSGKIVETLTRVAKDGTITDLGSTTLREPDNGCIEGRRPLGLEPTSTAWLASVPACFAEIARMEAAAVLAFRDLHRALGELGAPADLLARIDAARRDEIAHARVTAKLARRFEADVVAPRVAPSAAPTLLDLALDNAKEGCMREAFGALVAAFQAEHAEDAEVREVFARIADEEAEHAELSWALDAWYGSELDAEGRAAIARAKDEALGELHAACGVEPAEDVVRVAGMPTSAEARRLLGLLPIAVRALAAAA